MVHLGMISTFNILLRVVHGLYSSGQIFLKVFIKNSSGTAELF